MKGRRTAGGWRGFSFPRISFPVGCRRLILPFLCFAFSLFLGGCGNKFFDPTQVGRFRPKPAVNVILDSLGVAPETPSAWVGAEEPRPVDVMELETEYTFHPGDVMRVSIFELLQEGQIFINDFQVSETGKASIPEIGVISVVGLSEAELEEEIADILRPSKLMEPSVTVRLQSSQRRTFSILGDGVGVPGRYFLPRYSLRLADALATAGGISEFNVSYIYVSRLVTGSESEAGSVEAEWKGGEQEGQVSGEEEMLEIIKPHARGAGDGLVLASAEMASARELVQAAAPRDFEWTELKRAKEEAGLGRRGYDKQNSERSGASRIEWIFKDGKWVPVKADEMEPPEAHAPTVRERIAEPVEDELAPGVVWEQIGTGGVQSRVIEIPVDKFQAADPRYNIVIRPGDTIYVPVDIVGEFYMTGNVNRQGPIPLTGRPMTLKMAIAAAGGLGPLAWPKRCEVIRRLGKDREEIVLVDLDKIFSGEQPDFYVKVNDLINVGTHPTSRWRAVLRNAFRATYGFGFVYDRNFADIDAYERQLSNWF